MDRAGEKLRRARERLKLTYREVEEASQQIAARRGTPEFLIPLSRLADIENRGTVPTVFRLYSLCAIYRLDLHEVMRWYGVPAEELTHEALQLGLDETHIFPLAANGHAEFPVSDDHEIDFSKTAYLGQVIRRWGKIPFSYLNHHDLRHHRYGFIGLEDSSMFPIIRPGSLVLIDESRRKVARGGWTTEFDRPIYFLEHRDGFRCGWCSVEEDRLLVHPHPASEQRLSSFRYPDEIEVIGQVVGIVMLLEPRRRRSARPSTPAGKTSEALR